MIAGTERGLLLTCLWYIREVDPQTLLLTGLTRDGVYLVENGEVTGAVNNFRFNESPVGMLGRLTEVGRHRRRRCRGSGATTSTGPPCRRSGSRGSTCPPSARPAECPGRTPGGAGHTVENLKMPLEPGVVGAPGDPGPAVAVGGHQLPAAPVPADDGHPRRVLRSPWCLFVNHLGWLAAFPVDRRHHHPVLRRGVRQRRTGAEQRAWLHRAPANPARSATPAAPRSHGGTVTASSERVNGS